MLGRVGERGKSYPLISSAQSGSTSTARYELGRPRPGARLAVGQILRVGSGPARARFVATAVATQHTFQVTNQTSWWSLLAVREARPRTSVEPC